MPHGGGKKMEPNSDEYKVVRRWIAAGMPFGDEKDPTVTKITVFPDVRVSTKPLVVRMGSGIGNVEYWVSKVLPGKVLFEI